MKGYAIVDNKLCESDSIDQIKAAMPLIKNQFNKIDQELSVPLSTDKVDELLAKYDFWSDRWNQNILMLEGARRAEAIKQVQQSIRQITWPPDEAPSEGSSA